MLLANSSAPLLGLVDTAVIGHLPHAYYLGGVAIGAMVVTFLLWLVGFLRMSTTALTAQAQGAQDLDGEIRVLLQGLLAALTLAVLILMLMEPIKLLGFWAAGGSDEIQQVGQAYYDIRIWSLPAAFCNLVLLGFFMGRQQAKLALLISVLLNLVNLVLDIVFVWGLNWGVSGVAWASLIAEYFAFLLSLYFLSTLLGSRLSRFCKTQLRRIVDRVTLLAFFRLNSDIFLRTLCLEICFAFVTFQGARLGDEVVAANAVLMNFLLLISLGLDAIAYAAEVIVGYAKGAKNKLELGLGFTLCRRWSFIFAGVYSLLFLFAGDHIIGLISTIPSVVESANNYLPWIILMPLISHWCYFYDGVFIGLTRAREMRNSMIISVCVVFFPCWWLLSSFENHALWAALTALMAARGITLGWIYLRLQRDDLLLD